MHSVSQPAVQEIQTSKTASKAATWYCLAISALILAVSLAVFSPIFFNFFASDDMIHVSWLHQAIRNPDLILRNFSHPWLDVPTAKFYRPLISVTFVTDYLLWHENAIGYHVTNVLFHGFTSVFVFLFLMDLESWLNPGRPLRERLLYPAAAALLFALYPGHTEAVSWITARVDAVMAVFFAAALWCYMRWRLTARPLFLGACLISTALSLCSKEMAIVIPPTLFALDWICLSDDVKKVTRNFKRAFMKTAWLWAVLAVYFIVRTYSLGTPIGGYDDRISLSVPFASQVSAWVQGLKMLAFPINASLVPKNFWASSGWTFALLSASFALPFALFTRFNSRKVAFIFCFGLFSLVPVYKLFSISPDLEASRFAYLVSIAFCALVPIGLCHLITAGKARIHRITGAIVMVALLVASAGLLIKNNRAWVIAGRQANAISAASPEIRAEAQSRPCVLFNLPDSINGAYVTRGAFMGIFSGSKFAVVSIANNEPVSLYKQQISESTNPPACFWWNPKTSKFVRANTISVAGKMREINSETDPSASITIGSPTGLAIDGQRISVSSFAGEVPLNFNRSPWSVDFLDVPLVPQTSIPAHKSVGLRYTNSLQQNIEMWGTIIDSPGHPGHVLFNLHQRPDWFLGNKPSDVRLLLPANAIYNLGTIRALDYAKVSPTVHFSHGPALGSVVSLTRKSAKPIAISASAAIPGCAKLRLVVLKPLASFDSENAHGESDAEMFSRELNGTRVNFELRWSDFGSAAYHKARIVALDAAGMPLGLPSDSFLIQTLSN